MLNRLHTTQVLPENEYEANLRTVFRLGIVDTEVNSPQRKAKEQ